MPKLYILVGVPGSGKSTWVANQDWAKDCVVVSTDTHVENQAKFEGKTYSEVFKDFMPFAVKLMEEDVIKARNKGKDIIWDQTSTTILSRRKKLRMLPNYYAISILFRTPNKEELDRRLGQRPGKIIPKEVVEDMINKFEEPSESEGFKELWYVN